MPEIRHFLGLSGYHLTQKGQRNTVIYAPADLINGHLLLCGMSGTGKSWQSTRFLETAANAGVETDVFDVHGEFHDDQTNTPLLPNSGGAVYSQATRYGYNPLRLDTDPHTGGVEPQISFLVGMVKELTPQFGAKQEAALRYLLGDTYAAAGIYPDNSRSWDRQDITLELRRQIIDDRRWAELRSYYPTLADLRSYGERKLSLLLLGGDNKSVSALDRAIRAAQKLNAAQRRYAKAGDDPDKAAEAVARAKDEAKETYGDFVDKMESGRELQDLLKYDSKDVLAGVIQRLDNLAAAGIFEPNPPPFGNARVRIHHIKHLRDDQQVMFTKLRLREIFDRRKREGATASGTEVRHVIFLDEAHIFFSKEPDDIINKIAKEGRKFGIALWCASQSPTEFPEAFLTNVGTTVFLGLHSSYWEGTIRRYRMQDDSVLRFIRPKDSIAIKLQRAGQPDPPFQGVYVPNPSTQHGPTVIQYAKQR